MEKISQVMTWRKEQDLRGDVELIGTLKVMSMSVIKRNVVGDSEIEQAAKRQGADMIHRRLYGDVQSKLAELERILIAVLPASVSSDGPLERVRELQALVSGYK